MKDALLVMLLDVYIIKVSSLPYHVDSNTKCNNTNQEYLLEALGLCCKKCPPGWRLSHECDQTSETVCERCEPDQYMESWNYAPNCFPCAKCKPNKGLQFAQACSPIAMSKCSCQPGMYCIMESDEQHCTACLQHKSCKAGFGVSVPGTAHSNVKCKQCLNGTFSNTSSATEPCRPHTNCHERPVLREGTSTMDTLCKGATMTPTSMVTGTENPLLGPAVLGGSPSWLTKSPGADDDKVAAVASIVGTVMFFIIVAVILLVLYKTSRSKGAANLHPKDTLSGSLESGNELKTLRTSLTDVSPGEECRLLKSTEGSCDSGLGGGDTRSFRSSQNSFETPPSTLALPQQQPLPSGTDIHSCVPHISVNITFNIGDGGSHSPLQDLELSFREEQESISIPKQEAGKELPDQESLELHDSDKQA
nr:tumor necrosis factor receptor superfamily member 1B-like [Nerophis lumbriciformis]